MAEMTGIEIEGHLKKLGLVLPVLMQIPADELIKLYDHNDAVGWVFDPTAWMNTRENTTKNRRVARALRDFQKVIAEEYPEFIPAGDGS